MVADRHAVHGTPMDDAFAGKEMALFGMGCFWGAEKGFWLLPGVHSTSVGYAGGYTPNASYEEVCSGQTGHTEVVRDRVRSGGDVVRRHAEAVLGRTRSDAGHEAGCGRRHAVSFGHLLLQRRAAPCGRAVARRVSEAADGGGFRTRSPPRLRLRRSITSPRTTTSSTSPRIPVATAATAARA